MLKFWFLLVRSPRATIVAIAAAAACVGCSGGQSQLPAQTPNGNLTGAQTDREPGACNRGGSLERVSPGVFRLCPRIVQDVTLTAGETYFANGPVFVGVDKVQPASLTIEPGVVVQFTQGAGPLVVVRGSKIFANGTKDKPIVFTPTAKEGTRTRGMWGGLVLNGFARVNGCAAGQAICELQGEGSTGLYGGDNDDDSSGSLRYVRVEFAGAEITPDNELNGIAFQGVGRGTTAEYIQVHYNADDGVEFFGGTVDVKHLVLTGNRDDSIDYTSGWLGSIQFARVEQASDAGQHGIEGENKKEFHGATPLTVPTLANLSMTGPSSPESTALGTGVFLYRGAGLKLYNSVVANFRQGCLGLVDESTFERLAVGDVDIVNVAFGCEGLVREPKTGENVPEFDLQSWALELGNQLSLPNVFTGYPMPTEDSRLQKVNYIGAFDPAVSESERWDQGWTTEAPN